MYGIIYLLVLIIWAIFVAYWVFSRVYEKVTHQDKPVKKGTSTTVFWGFRIIAIIIILLLITHDGGNLFNGMIIPYYSELSIAGVIILACGIGFAIWARMHLGGNWSGVIVLKEGQTLTKTGPYSIVRHPIYTGLFFAGIGTFMAIGNLIALIFAIGILLFTLNRVRIEEKLMLEKFGKQYAQYQKQTKKIIPFIY